MITFKTSSLFSVAAKTAKSSLTARLNMLYAITASDVYIPNNSNTKQFNEVIAHEVLFANISVIQKSKQKYDFK